MACSYDSKTGDTEIHGLAKFQSPVFPETGSHAFVLFSEMHFAPSYRAQEVPRLLPPVDSVPVTGKEITFKTIEPYREMSAAPAGADQYDAAHAVFLYDRNCLVCHGADLKGNGLIRTIDSATGDGLAMNRGPFPSDLTADITQNSTIGDIYAFITFGGRQGFAAYSRDRQTTSPMPHFQHLLSEADRWALARYVLEH